MSGQGAFKSRGAHCVPTSPTHHPPALPWRPVSMSHQPFWEHVLQHSCCSTFLWQRLFFLTSTQKLPSAQDSSFAFHRPGRRNTGGVWKKGRGETCAHTHTQIYVEIYISTGQNHEKWLNEWQSRVIGQERFQMTGWFFVLIQSQVTFIEAENDCSPVEWLVPCQWRGKTDLGGKKKNKREREKHITQLANLRYFKFTTSFYITENLKWTQSVQQK